MRGREGSSASSMRGLGASEVVRAVGGIKEEEEEESFQVCVCGGVASVVVRSDCAWRALLL